MSNLSGGGNQVFTRGCKPSAGGVAASPTSARTKSRPNWGVLPNWVASALAAVAVTVFSGACSEPALESTNASQGPGAGMAGAPAANQTAGETAGIPDAIPALVDGLDVPEETGPNIEGQNPPPVTEDTACVQKSLTSTQTTRPVDIIFVIDNSGSMDDEISEVETQINRNFANIIEDAGIDYRVVMISSYGANDGSRRGVTQLTAQNIERITGSKRLYG